VGRGLVAVLVAGAVFGAVYGSAASLGGLTVGTMGADSAQVTSCDADGVDASFEVGWGGAQPVISAVNVSGIADACLDHSIAVVLTAGGQPVGLGRTTVGVGVRNNNAAHVVLAPQPAAKVVDGIAIVIQ